MRFGVLAGTTALAALLAGSSWAASPSPFSGVAAFGDSLSDAGNIATLSGSPVPLRYTTNPGRTAIEDVAAGYGLNLTASLLGGTDFAYGGAGVVTNAPGTPGIVPTETQQITAYLAANPKVSPNQLYSVFGGANDIFYHAAAAVAGAQAQTLIAQIPAATPAAIQAALVQRITAGAEAAAGVSALESQTDAFNNVTAAAAQELTLIGGLQKAGARYIVVFNLPDIGKTPTATAENAAFPGAAAALTAVSQGYNNVLQSGLGKLGVGIIPVNTYALLNEIIANPTPYGFTNTTTPACTVPTAVQCTPATLVTPSAPSTFLFADGVHPTTAAHALFAQYIAAEIAAPRQASLLAEAPLGYLEGERGAVNAQLLDDQATPATGLRLFASGGYAYQHIKGESFTPSAHDDDGMVTAGVDWRPRPDVSFGAELTGGGGSERLNGELRRFNTSEVMGSVFAQYIWRAAYVNGGLGFGTVHFGDIQRSFDLDQAVRVENGSTSGSTEMADVEAGYWFGAPALRAGPFVGGVYEHVKVDGFGETGGDSTAMTFANQSREALVGRAGWRVQGDLPTGWGALVPFVQVNYAYDGDARTRDVVGGLVSMPGLFAIPGFTPDREWGEVQAGLNAHIGPHWTAFIAYQGRFAGRTTDYDSGDVGLRYAF